MRVSTYHQYQSYQGDIQRAQQSYVDAQRRIVTGKKFESASEDPLGASLVLNIGQLKSAVEQYQSNLRNAKDYLGFSESAISDIKDLAKKAYTTALRAANSSTDQTARDGMAREIVQVQQRLVDLANSKGSNGQYLFAGQLNQTKPFSVSGNALVYSGDGNDVRVETGPQETMAVNSKMSGVFTQMYSDLEQLKTDLTGGNLANLGGVDVQNLQNRLNSLVQEIGEIGAKQSTVSDLETQNTRRIDDLTKQISDTQDVDMSQAIADMKLAEVSYQAALQVASQGFKLSLMDFIRG